MNYFRFYIAILASFSPFFAYIARLNLSISMDSMCITNEAAKETTVSQLSPKTMPFLYTIEHTYAFLSSTQEREKVARKVVNKTKTSSKPIWRLPQSIVPLNIDIDKTTNSSINRNSQFRDDQDDVKIEAKSYQLLWTNEQQSDLLGAYFYGYAICQILAAIFGAAEIFGAKPLFLLTGLGSSILSLIFPLAAKQGYVYAFIVRVLLGATHGVMFPAVYVFFCQWLPKNERPKWLPFPSAFSRLGTILMNLILPIILRKFSWESAFYLTGGAALFWSIIFMSFATSKPKDNVWLSREELVYIESHMEPQTKDLTKSAITASGFTINESSAETEKRVSPSLIKLFFNKPVLIMSLVMFTAEWSNVILLVKLFDFLNSVFDMDSGEYGYWNSGMIVIFCFTYPFSGWLATKLDNSDFAWFTPLRVRKMFELTANLLQAFCCILIAFSDSKAVVLGSLFLMMVGRSMVGGGQCLMPPELSKELSGTVFAYSNTIANVAGMLGPSIMQRMVGEQKKVYKNWFSFYILSACIFIVGGVVFTLFGDIKPQNFLKKKKFQSNLAMSQAQLVNMEPEVLKMDAFPTLSTKKTQTQTQTKSS